MHPRVVVMVAMRLVIVAAILFVRRLTRCTDCSSRPSRRAPVTPLGRLSGPRSLGQFARLPSID